jgi:DNA polymerase
MLTAAIDFETYYSKDVGIDSQGVWHYCRHPEFDAYLVTISTSTGQKYCGRPENFDWSCISGENWRWVSHNRSFDKPVYESIVENGKIPAHFPHVWDCTADLSAFLGVPRNLKGASEALFKAQMSKDTRNKMKGKRWEDMDEAFRREVEEYAIADADYCLKIWEEHGHKWPEHEQWLSQETTRMCIQGVPVNKTVVRDRIEHLKVLLWEAEQKLPWVQEEKKTLSPLALAEECRKVGILPPPSLAEDSQECEAWEKEYGDRYPWVGAMRQFRKCNALLRKLETMEKRTRPDGWMGYGLRYFGASTGRDSGDAGLNMQNLQRAESYGVNVRGLIEAPEGMTLVVADLAQIEPRCLAWLAGDTDMLDFIRQSPDLYEAQARAWGFWDKPESLRSDTTGIRHLVKQCVAEGSLVLTHEGLVPIENVTTSHKVWDGENFVTHEGLVFQGEREVIEYDGVIATPDHMVFVGGYANDKIELQQAARELRTLTRTGTGRTPIQLLGSGGQQIHQDGGQGVQGVVVQMHQMQQDYPEGFLRQSEVGKVPGMHPLQQTEWGPRVYSETDGCGKTTLCEPERPELPELRGSGDNLSLEECFRGGEVGYGEYGGASNKEVSVGSDRQQQRLRAGKHTMGASKTEPDEQKDNKTPGGLCISRGRVANVQTDSREVFETGYVATGTFDSCETNGVEQKSDVEIHKSATRKVRVYDLLNCGPNHRFTVNGRLISNCNLGLGYSMGVNRFSDTTGMDKTEASRLVHMYRQKNPKVVELWKRLENNLRSEIIKNSDTFTMELPSGRVLTYRNPNNNEGHLSAEVVRSGKFLRLKWFGGALVENITQGMARDVFMECVRKIREVDLNVIMRVHDEVVVCIREDRAQEAKEFILDVMSTPPEWAKTLPLAAEAKITKRYEK